MSFEQSKQFFVYNIKSDGLVYLLPFIPAARVFAAHLIISFNIFFCLIMCCQFASNSQKKTQRLTGVIS